MARRAASWQTTGPHGIQIGEELAAERHRANEVLEHFAQGPFGSGQPQSLGKAPPVVNEGARDVTTRGAGELSSRYSPSRRSRPVSLIRWLTLMTWTLLRPAFLAA